MQKPLSSPAISVLEDDPHNKKGIYQKPFYLVGIITLAIFIAEVVVMFVLLLLPPVSIWFEAVMDAMLLIGISSPTIYFLIFKPLITHIKKRKLVEEAIKESEKRFRDVAMSTSDWIWEVDLRGCYTYCSKRVEDVLGYSADEIVGRPIYDLMPPDEAVRMRNILEEVYKNRTPIADLENWKLKKDNQRVCLLTSGIPIYDRDGGFIGYRGVDKNITNRILAQKSLQMARDELALRVKERTAQLNTTNAQLLHAEKLSAMGKLAASFAHEFNNPLFGIKMVLEQLTEKPNFSETERKSVRMAIKECSRMSSMIENLKDFYRPSSGILMSVDINGLIEDMLQICGKKLKISRVKVVKDFAEDISPVPLVADQLKQVVLNLITNAEEAMVYSGGCLTIKTKVKDNKAYIIFKDNGSGIDKEIIGKIFDPFFTTKGAVKGSGLGLSVSYGIIKGHGGDILVESAPGKGSSFIIELPLNPDNSG